MHLISQIFIFEKDFIIILIFCFYFRFNIFFFVKQSPKGKMEKNVFFYYIKMPLSHIHKLFYAYGCHTNAQGSPQWRKIIIII